MKPIYLVTILLLQGAIFIHQGYGQAARAKPAPGQEIKYGDNASAGHWFRGRGFNMYYELYGAGRPLLLIHGNGGAIDNFTNQIPYFSGEYRVIAVDSRAQGKSADPADSLSFEMMADDFSALLDELHLDSVYVIGWSDGGINGLLLAIRHPEKVRKLAITGANLWPDTTGQTPFVYHLIEHASVELHKKPQTAEVKARLKLVDLDFYQPHITLEQLHTIRCPVLVIGGDHDVIPVRHTMLIAENIPQSYLWIVPNSGHSTPIFKKDQFNPLIRDFFQHPYREIKGVATFQ